MSSRSSRSRSATAKKQVAATPTPATEPIPQPATRVTLRTTSSRSSGTAETKGAVSVNERAGISRNSAEGGKRTTTLSLRIRTPQNEKAAAEDVATPPLGVTTRRRSQTTATEPATASTSSTPASEQAMLPSASHDDEPSSQPRRARAKRSRQEISTVTSDASSRKRRREAVEDAGETPTAPSSNDTGSSQSSNGGIKIRIRTTPSTPEPASPPAEGDIDGAERESVQEQDLFEDAPTIVINGDTGKPKQRISILPLSRSSPTGKRISADEVTEAPRRKRTRHSGGGSGIGQGAGGNTGINGSHSGVNGAGISADADQMDSLQLDLDDRDTHNVPADDEDAALVEAARDEMAAIKGVALELNKRRVDIELELIEHEIEQLKDGTHPDYIAASREIDERYQALQNRDERWAHHRREALDNEHRNTVWMAKMDFVSSRWNLKTALIREIAAKRWQLTTEYEISRGEGLCKEDLYRPSRHIVEAKRKRAIEDASYIPSGLPPGREDVPQWVKRQIRVARKEGVAPVYIPPTCNGLSEMEADQDLAFIRAMKPIQIVMPEMVFVE
ncbi:hypothetical protein HDV00_001108 [Rhizophlyctis rosea]|nr:hypothetical protein HDV00_001108 [Rhizophlyctis rosea]